MKIPKNVSSGGVHEDPHQPMAYDDGDGGANNSLELNMYVYCRHVSSSDRVGRRYRNMASIFTIGDGDEEGL